MSTKSAYSLSYTALGVAIIATLAQIAIPLQPVPFTCLTIGVGLVATLLKGKEALSAGGIYLILGALGLPVFAGFSGGIHNLFGPTGGYLWGILAYCLITGYSVKISSSPVQIFWANLIGDALLFVCGFLGLIFLAKLSPQAAFLNGVLPFVLFDLIKILLITSLAKLLQPILAKQNYFKS